MSHGPTRVDTPTQDSRPATPPRRTASISAAVPEPEPAVETQHRTGASVAIALTTAGEAVEAAYAAAQRLGGYPVTVTTCGSELSIFSVSDVIGELQRDADKYTQRRVDYTERKRPDGRPGHRRWFELTVDRLKVAGVSRHGLATRPTVLCNVVLRGLKKGSVKANGNSVWVADTGVELVATSMAQAREWAADIEQNMAAQAARIRLESTFSSQGVCANEEQLRDTINRMFGVLPGTEYVCAVRKVRVRAQADWPAKVGTRAERKAARAAALKGFIKRGERVRVLETTDDGRCHKIASLKPSNKVETGWVDAMILGAPSLTLPAELQSQGSSPRADPAAEPVPPAIASPVLFTDELQNQILDRYNNLSESGTRIPSQKPCTDSINGEWWNRTELADEEDALEEDEEHGIPEWWRAQVGLDPQGYVHARPPKYVFAYPEHAKGQYAPAIVHADEQAQFPLSLDNGVASQEETDVARPPALPHQKKKYLDNRPVVRPVQPIKNVPAAVQAVLAESSGPKFGFLHPYEVQEQRRHQETEAAAVEELDSVLERSCFIFARSGSTRKACILASESSIFEGFVLALIGGNSLCLAMYDPLNPESDENKLLDDLGIVFTLLFAIEMFTKMIAMGVIFGDTAYLRTSGWNWVDFVVVVSGFTDFIPNYDNDLGVFRTIRLLRPLRTITSIRGMRVLVGTLLQPETLAGIGNVCLLCCFIFIVAGIIGVNLFSGTLQPRCFDQITLKLISENQMCSEDGAGYTCPDGEFCSRVDPITGIVNDNPGGNMVQFDNFGIAVLTVFTMLTLEGWTDVMYAVQDGFTSFAWIYFVILITFGTFIGLNLFLAVISAGYEKMAEEVDEEKTLIEHANYLLKCLKIEVHKSLHREQPSLDNKSSNVKNMQVGDWVKLTPQAVKKWADRGRGNLTEHADGEVVKFDAQIDKFAAEDAEKVRIRVNAASTESNSQGWRAQKVADQQVEFWFPIGDVHRIRQTQADEQLEEQKRLEHERELNRIKEQRIRRFFHMFDSDGSNCITRSEFVKGLIVVAEENPVEMKHAPDDPIAIYIEDKPMRALLHLLTKVDSKGNDREWQNKMVGLLFDALDDDYSGQVTMSEFKGHFMNDKQWLEKNEEVKLSCMDLKHDQLVGMELVEVLCLYCKYLCQQKYFTDFVSVVVLLNCAVLGGAYYGQPADYADLLERINFICTIIFIVEMFIKLLGLTAKGYVSDSLNIFDGVIVFMSVVEWFLPDGDTGGISVFRALRILRIVKLTQSMENFRKVLKTIVSIVPDMSNFFALLMLFIFFFAVMGLHLFGGTFTSDIFEERPRSNFDSFGNALMSVFQVLTGENWNSLMYDTVQANGKTGPIAYFVMLNILGVYVMLNLFLAVLLLKTTEAFMPQKNPKEEVLQRARVAKEREDMAANPEETSEFVLEGRSLFIFGINNPLRKGLCVICENTAFDNLILTAIIISSVALAIEEPGQSQDVLDVIVVLDLVFTALFVFEMASKIIVLGLVVGSKYCYLRNGWNVLDGCVVLASVTSIALKESNISWVRGFRVFRALRPLRVIKRVPELRVVVNSLFRSAPTIANVIVLLGMLWMIFGILGVQLFQGKFYSCMNDGSVVGVFDCSGTIVVDGKVLERAWKKPLGWGFDNLGEAITTLFEVSTLEMWLDIMYITQDASPEDGMQPLQAQDGGVVTLFFVFYIFIGSFFIMELFVGATVTSYNQLNEESAGGAFQSERQKQQVAKIVLKDNSDIYEAQYDWQLGLYQIAHSSLVENFIMLCIVLNIVLMALSFDGMSEDYTNTLDLFNDIFTFIFTAEAVIKIGGEFPSRYFKQAWNQYDFFVVAVTLTEFIYTKMVPGGEIPGASILRVFRIARIFRLLKKMKGLTKLFLTMAHALPTMMNVGGVLFLLFFIYGVLGMHLFGRVRRGEFLNEHANFENFGSSLLLVFRMATGESWNGVMNECRNDVDCDPDANDGLGDCGSPIALFFFLSFQLIGQYVMLNLFIAVMLEYYQREQDASDPALTTDDNKTFEKVWTEFVGREARYPNKMCQLMPVQLFDDFMERLPPHIGWSHSERMSGRKKMQALQQMPFSRLSVRALKMLVPWKPGMPRYIDGVVKFNDRQEKQGTGVVDKPKDDDDDMLEEDDNAETFAGPWKSETAYVPVVKQPDGSFMGMPYKPGDEDKVQQFMGDEKRQQAAELASAGASPRGMLQEGVPPQAAPNLEFIPHRIEKQKAEPGSYVRPTKLGDREPGVRYRCVGYVTDTKDGKAPLSNIKSDSSGPADSEVRLSGDVEPDWKRLSERSTPGRSVQLYDGGLRWEREDAEVRLMEKYRLREEQLPRCSTMEMHYYHVSEVWHCLYERAEMRHLRDPENLDIKDEDARRRRIDILENIMNTTHSDVVKKVSLDADADSEIRQAKWQGSNVTPYDNFTAMRVQQHGRRRKERRRLKQMRTDERSAGAQEAVAYAKRLFDGFGGRDTIPMKDIVTSAKQLETESRKLPPTPQHTPQRAATGH